RDPVMARQPLPENAATLPDPGSPFDSSEDTSPGVGDRFFVEQEIGRGGMGRVVLATDRRIGREVAIKVLLNARGAQAIARFEREALMTARLQHPAIIAVYDVGRRASGEPYLVMPRVQG